MSDFEISGLHSLKQQLTLMSRQPRAVRSHNPIAERLIDEIYPELRQAKIAGYSWKDLSALISDKCKIKLSANTASKLFRILDLRYEKETGVKALPVAKKYGGRKKAKSTDTKSDPEDETPEEIGAPASTYTGKSAADQRKAQRDMKPESVDAMLDTYKKMKKRCPKCKKGTAMVSANKAGWVLHCSKCDYVVQVEGGTLIGALRKWNDDRYEIRLRED